jgi:tetratricopeptide (TPR) repeat protein
MSEGVRALTRTGHRNFWGFRFSLLRELWRSYREVTIKWNGSKCMNKPRWLLTRTAIKGLLLILALGLSLGACSRSFARDNDPDLLDQQVLKLYQEGKYQEAIPIAEKLLAIRKRTLGLDHLSTVTSLNNLASLYAEMGDYTRAEPLLEQALQVLQRALGSDSGAWSYAYATKVSPRK